MIKNVMSSNVRGKKKKKRNQKLSKTHKAKVTVTFLKEQNIHVLAHVTTVHIQYDLQDGFAEPPQSSAQRPLDMHEEDPINFWMRKIW